MNPILTVVLLSIVFVGVAVASGAATRAWLEHRRELRSDICGDLPPSDTFLPIGLPEECVLHHGHRTRWHQDRHGARWTEATA